VSRAHGPPVHEAVAAESLSYRMGHRFDLAENDPAQHVRLIGQVELVEPVLEAFGTDIAFDNAGSRS
jgi:hypothetical protein